MRRPVSLSTLGLESVGSGEVRVEHRAVKAKLAGSHAHIQQARITHASNHIAERGKDYVTRLGLLPTAQARQ
jgi:hypothetical protein